MRCRNRSTYSCSSFCVWADSTSFVRPTNLLSSVGGLGAGRMGVWVVSVGSLPIGASSSAVASVRNGQKIKKKNTLAAVSSDGRPFLMNMQQNWYIRIYTWLRLWHVDNGAAVRTLAGDRDHTHGLSGQGDVRQRCSNNCSCSRGHWHPTVQHHWKIRNNQVNISFTLQEYLLMIAFQLILWDRWIPSELAWAASVAPAGLSSSEVEDEEDEVTREWESLFLFRAEPVQLSKYLQNTKNLKNKHEDPPDLMMLPLHTWWCCPHSWSAGRRECGLASCCLHDLWPQG